MHRTAIISMKDYQVSGPIFIFSSSWRSGSTLLQRLINASNEVLIWGEPGGALDAFQDAHVRLQQMLGEGGTKYKHGFGGNGASQFARFKSGEGGIHDKWIACMNPPLVHIEQQLKGLLDGIYRGPAEALGYSRWGLKEVRSGIETAEFLRKLYPEAKFVFLVRNPFDSILSIKKRKWLDAVNYRDPLYYFANHWRKLSGEYRKAGFGLLIRFEDLVSDRNTTEKLGKYLGIESIPVDFIETSHADWPTESKQGLSFKEKMRLRYLLKEEMGHYGYL